MRKLTNVNCKKATGVYFIEKLEKNEWVIIYVGSSSDVAKRYSYHASKLKYGNHGKLELQRLADNEVELRMRVVQYLDDIDEARAIEQKYIENLSGLLNVKTKTAQVNTYTNVAKKKMSKSQSGINNPSAKLSKYDVYRILAALEDGFSIKELAEKYDVRPSNIYKIAKGETWKHPYICFKLGKMGKVSKQFEDVINQMREIKCDKNKDALELFSKIWEENQNGIYQNKKYK